MLPQATQGGQEEKGHFASVHQGWQAWTFQTLHPEHISSSLFQKDSSSDKPQSRRYRSPRSTGAAASAYLPLGTLVYQPHRLPHPHGSQGFREPLCKGHYTSMSQLHTLTGYRNSPSCDIKITGSFSLLLVTSSTGPLSYESAALVRAKSQI